MSLTTSKVDMDAVEASTKSDQSTSTGSSSLYKRLGPLSPARQSQYSTNTLMIDRRFQDEWINILNSLESQLPAPRPDLISGFTVSFHRMDPQLRLLNGIDSDNAFEVNKAILEGAKFLSVNVEDRIRTTNYYPVEYAVVMNKLEALKVMLNHMVSINSNEKVVFLGGLLIRAVQSGHLRAMKLLIGTYQASYLKNAFLLQQAIMHKAPVSVLSFIIEVYSSVPELLQFYGKHHDYALHLAVKYDNPRAFAFLFENTNFPRNDFNADTLRPINLIFKIPRNQFLYRLFSKHPILKSQWKDEYGNNLLHLAAHQESLEHIKLFVQDFKFYIDHVNRESQTALFIACSLQQRPIVYYLLEQGANALIPDKKGVCPLLIIARLNDFKLFSIAINFLQFQVYSVYNLQVVTQHLIYGNLWDFIVIMLEKFPSLMAVDFRIYLQQFEYLETSSLLYNLPNLLEYFVSKKFIRPRRIILKAVALGKVHIVKYLLELGETGVDISKLMEVAIVNNQIEMIRFLTSFGGLIISPNCPLKSFILVLTNGASFSPNSFSKLNFVNRNDVLILFVKYFSLIRTSNVIATTQLAIMLIQLEIFIFYNITYKPITSELIGTINDISNLKTIISEAIHNSHNLLSILTSSFTPKNSRFLNIFIEHLSSHSLTAVELSSLISAENSYLLSEYNAIL